MVRGPVHLVWLALLVGGAHGQSVAPSNPGGSASVVYRCPGPPVSYTNAISPAEAREKGCRSIEGTPITVVQMPKVRPAASGARPGEGRVDPSAQRQRDNDARGILESELQREEEKLSALKKEYNNGEPERLGQERNFQNYLDRVSALRASIARSESDIAAIRRELSKLGG